MSMLPFVLAQSGESEITAGLSNFNQALRNHPDLLNKPDELAPILQETPLVWALVFIVVGGFCVGYGYRSHKMVITVLAALAGVWLGLSMGDHVGDQTITAICMALLFGVLSYPLLRFQVAAFGGVCGAFAGANLFTTLFTAMERANHSIPTELEQIRNTPYLGAFVGLVVVSMLAFLAFRAVTILLTTILGSTLLVCGAIAALMHNTSWAVSLADGMKEKPLMVPVVVSVIAIIGASVQLSGGVKGLKTIADRADPKSQKPAPAKA